MLLQEANGENSCYTRNSWLSAPIVAKRAANEITDGVAQRLWFWDSQVRRTSLGQYAKEG